MRARMRAMTGTVRVCHLPHIRPFYAYLLVAVWCLTGLSGQAYWDLLTPHIAADWQSTTYTFADAGCLFSTENVQREACLLKLLLDVVHNDGDLKIYRGSSVVSRHLYGYGRFTVRMKNNIKKGTVSSFFIMNPWQADDWRQQEIDIEFLGSDTSKIQFTTHFYTDGVDALHAYTYDLGFDSNSEFHNYGIHWTRHRVEWLVDGVVVYSETRDMPVCTEMNIFMNHWLGNPVKPDVIRWLGSVSDSDLPSEVFYAWVMYEPEPGLDMAEPGINK